MDRTLLAASVLATAHLAGYNIAAYADRYDMSFNRALCEIVRITSSAALEGGNT